MTSVTGLTSPDTASTTLPDDVLGQEIDDAFGSVGEKPITLTNYASSYQATQLDSIQEDEDDDGKEEGRPPPKRQKGPDYTQLSDDAGFDPAFSEADGLEEEVEDEETVSEWKGDSAVDGSLPDTEAADGSLDEDEEEEGGPPTKRLKVDTRLSDEANFDPALKPLGSSVFSQEADWDEEGEELEDEEPEEEKTVSEWEGNSAGDVSLPDTEAVNGSLPDTELEMDSEPLSTSFGSLRGGLAPPTRRRMSVVLETALSSAADHSVSDPKNKSQDGPTRRRRPPTTVEEALDEGEPPKKPPDRSTDEPPGSSSVGETVSSGLGSGTMADTADEVEEVDEEIIRLPRSGRSRDALSTAETFATDSRLATSLPGLTTSMKDSRGPVTPRKPPKPILKSVNAPSTGHSVHFNLPSRSEDSAPAARGPGGTTQVRTRRISTVFSPASAALTASSLPAASNVSSNPATGSRSEFFSQSGPEYNKPSGLADVPSRVTEKPASGLDSSNGESVLYNLPVAARAAIREARRQERLARSVQTDTTEARSDAAGVPGSTNDQQLDPERDVRRIALPPKPDSRFSAPDTSLSGAQHSELGGKSSAPASSVPYPADSRAAQSGTTYTRDPPAQTDPPPVPGNRPPSTSQQRSVAQSSNAPRSLGDTDFSAVRHTDGVGGETSFSSKPPYTPGGSSGQQWPSGLRGPRAPGDTNAGHTGPPASSGLRDTDASTWDASQQRPQYPGRRRPGQDALSTAATRQRAPPPGGRSTAFSDARPPAQQQTSRASAPKPGEEYLPRDYLPEPDVQFTSGAESSNVDGRRSTDQGVPRSPSSMLPSERRESRPGLGSRLKSMVGSLLPSWSRRSRQKRFDLESDSDEDEEVTSPGVPDTMRSGQTGLNEGDTFTSSSEAQDGPVEHEGLGGRRTFERPGDAMARTGADTGTRGVAATPRRERRRAYETDESAVPAGSTREPPGGSSALPPREPPLRDPPRRGQQAAGDQTTADATTQATSQFQTDDSAFTDRTGRSNPYKYSNTGRMDYHRNEFTPATSYVPSPPRDNTFLNDRMGDGQYSQAPPPAQAPPDMGGHSGPGSPPRHDQTTDFDDPGRRSRYDYSEPDIDPSLQRFPWYSESNHRGPRYRASKYSTNPPTSLSSRAMAAMPSILDAAVQGLAKRRASRASYASSSPFASNWTRGFFRDVAGAVADAGIERLRQKPYPSMRRELASAVLPILKDRVSKRFDRSSLPSYNDSEYSSGSGGYDDGYRSTRGVRGSRRRRTGYSSGTRGTGRRGRLRRSRETTRTRSRGGWLTRPMRSMARFAHDVRTGERDKEAWVQSRVADVRGVHQGRYDPVLEEPGGRMVRAADGSTHPAYMSRREAQNTANSTWARREEKRYSARPQPPDPPVQPDDFAAQQAGEFADDGNLNDVGAPGGPYGPAGPRNRPWMATSGMVR